MRKTLVTFLLAAFVAVPANAAAAEWRSVGAISTPGEGATILSYGIDAQGVFTTFFRDIDIDDEAGTLQERDRGPGGRLVRGPAFGGDVGLPVLAIAPAGERIAAYATGAEGAQRVEVRTRVPGANWSEPQVVAESQTRVIGLDVDVAPSGEAVVSWSDVRTFNPTIDATLTAAARPAGAPRFVTAQTIDRGNIYGHDLDLDAAGNAVVTYADRDSRQVRYALRAAGGVFGPPQRLTTPGDPVVEWRDVAVDVAPGGRAVVTWRLGAEAAGPSAVAASAGTTTGGFGQGRVLSDNAGGIGAAVEDDLAAITWVDQPGARGRVKVILLPAGADLAAAPRRTLSGTAVPYGNGEVAVARGRATFAWVRRVAGPRVVEARTATAAGAFTRTQTLSSRSDTASQIVVTTSSRGESWVAWNGQRRPDLRIDTTQASKASSRTGVFTRATTIARGPGGLDQLELIPSVGGSMLAVYRRGYWYMRTYGERP